MPVTVVLPGVLRQYADGESELKLDLGAGGDVTDLLDAVTARHPALGRRLRDEQGALRRYVNVYVDGEDVRLTGGLTVPVASDAEVLVLPSVAGG